MQSVAAYIVPVDTPAQSPYDVLAYGATQSPWQDTVLSGDEIALTIGYCKKRDMRYKDDDNLTVTKGTAQYGRWFGTSTIHSITTMPIQRVRQTDIVNSHACFVAFNQAMARKISAAYYPEYVDYPLESVGIMVDKRKADKRVGSLEYFTFDFDFTEVGSAQIPSSIPAFV